MPQPFTRDELTSVDRSRHAEDRVVRFQDVDAAGIVFYPTLFEYFSDVYIGMILASGYDLPSRLTKGSMVLPLVHAEGDFLRPLRFGDAVTVEVACVKLGATSFTVGYRIVTPARKLAAVGQTVHVCLDPATFRPQPLPEDLRALLDGP